MADTPPEPGILFTGHAAPAFAEGGDREGGWEGRLWSWSGFEEDLVGDAAVFVFVAASLADTL